MVAAAAPGLCLCVRGTTRLKNLDKWRRAAAAARGAGEGVDDVVVGRVVPALLARVVGQTRSCARRRGCGSPGTTRRRRGAVVQAWPGFNLFMGFYKRFWGKRRACRRPATVALAAPARVAAAPPDTTRRRVRPIAPGTLIAEPLSRAKQLRCASGTPRRSPTRQPDVSRRDGGGRARRVAEDCLASAARAAPNAESPAGPGRDGVARRGLGFIRGGAPELDKAELRRWKCRTTATSTNFADRAGGVGPGLNAARTRSPKRRAGDGGGLWAGLIICCLWLLRPRPGVRGQLASCRWRSISRLRADVRRRARAARSSRPRAS